MLAIAAISIIYSIFFLLPFVLPKSMTPFKRDELIQWYLFCAALITVTGSTSMAVRIVMLISILAFGARTFFLVFRERRILTSDKVVIEKDGMPAQTLPLGKLMNKNDVGRSLFRNSASIFYWRNCIGEMAFTLKFYQGENLVDTLKVASLNMGKLQCCKDRGHLSSAAFAVGDTLHVAVMGTNVLSLPQAVGHAIGKRVRRPVTDAEAAAEAPEEELPTEEA